MYRGVYGYTACVRLGITVTEFNENRDAGTGALISPDNGAGGSVLELTQTGNSMRPSLAITSGNAPQRGPALPPRAHTHHADHQIAEIRRRNWTR